MYATIVNHLAKNFFWYHFHLAILDSSTTKPFDIIYVDIQGPLAINQLFMVIPLFLIVIDDHRHHTWSTQVTWIYLMNSKFESRLLLQHFVSLVKTQYNTTIEIIRSYNNGVCLSKHHPSYFLHIQKLLSKTQQQKENANVSGMSLLVYSFAHIFLTYYFLYVQGLN